MNYLTNSWVMDCLQKIINRVLFVGLLHFSNPETLWFLCPSSITVILKFTFP